MEYQRPIRYRFAVRINLLVIPLLVLLSVLFYLQFQRALNQRVLLQLSSIKQLKRVQIEDYLNRERQRFEVATGTVAELDNMTMIADDTVWLLSDRQALSDVDRALDYLYDQPPGVHDLSRWSVTGHLLLGFRGQTTEGMPVLAWSPALKIQEILLERTGMGETGETYLVGADSLLRSQSRFFPEKQPLQIKAPTQGVAAALGGQQATGIFDDYRGVRVYSAYGPLQIAGLDWAILSEIDESEALSPLISMQRRLFLISLIIVLVTVIVSLQLAGQLARPISRMKDLLSEMALGNFDVRVKSPSHGDEVEAMFQALDQLKHSVSQAMLFARDVGRNQLHKQYQVLSEHDVLGQALVRMRDKLREYHDQEEALQLQNQRALLEGQEKERTRLSRELHDGLGPLLTSLKHMIQRVDLEPGTKQRIKELLDETIAEVRRMTYNLMPQALVDFGVGPALHKLATVMQRATGIAIHYQQDGELEFELPEDLNIGIYRIAQEALNNAVKHAAATEVHMSLTVFPDRISLFFRDNGHGFDPEHVSSGAGLVNMKERCRVMGGDFDLHSGPTGTTIEVDIPLHHD